jgi:hypothetical protein
LFLDSYDDFCATAVFEHTLHRERRLAEDADLLVWNITTSALRPVERRRPLAPNARVVLTVSQRFMANPAIAATTNWPRSCRTETAPG